jgi:ribose transport system ATP-binding protein
MNEAVNTNVAAGTRVPAVALRGVSKHFQAIRALREVSIDFHAGEVHILMGENGAGKSTLIGVLAGVHRPTAGHLEMAGREFSLSNPHDAMAIGIASVFQEPALVPQLTVAENLMLGREPTTKWGFLRRRTSRENALSALSRTGTRIDPDRLVRDLSRAERQIVEIARALQSSARVLILDEPTASLTEEETEQLFETVTLLRSEGLAIIYITHRIQEIRRIGDTLSVLRDGQLVRTCGIDDVDNDEIVTLMTGREIGATFPVIRHQPQGTVLELDNVSGPSVQGASIYVRSGEIVGLTGLVGSGKDEVGQICFGLSSPTGGEVRINGKPAHRHSPSARLAEGVVFYPADRKHDGLNYSRPVWENVSLTSLDRWTGFGFVRREAERRDTSAVLKQLNLRPFAPEALPGSFSGGNQQKVVLARGFVSEYTIHVFDEPTTGVDVGARTEIYKSIKELVEQGVAILLISSDLPEVVGLAHRAYVMAEGRIVGEFAGDELNEETLLPAFFNHTREELRQ